MSTSLTSDGYPRKPRTPIAFTGRDSWYYIGDWGIELFVTSPEGVTINARLSWRQIELAMKYRKAALAAGGEEKT